MNTPISLPAEISDEALNNPRSRTAFRTVKLLVGGYVAISVLTLVAVYLLRDDAGLVTDTVWVRGGIVVLSSLLMLAFATGTTRGRRRAYLRLRIASGVMVVAIAVLVALPGFLPMWMRIEQTVCGLLLVCVVAIVNGRHLRSLFATR
ncbi:hypothetical protein Psi02_64630 [Planotetraspora silvatica]|uniref:Uncharacterized protein n=1 Tax=Planotetraspora silvatica TaxID=234614 RepID=A0A8J3UX56_9ACTN|nr:hypothetical protein [Planotetraspora silvatica]GII50039.1 hypothetical protein Psi02_64630 [Planotetraspora silvatica]